MKLRKTGIVVGHRRLDEWRQRPEPRKKHFEFFCSQAESTPAHTPLMLTVGRLRWDRFILQMIKIMLRGHSLEIRPITQDDLEAVLNVYRQCEDFLALGPVPTASMDMVLKDLEISRGENGVFCGIYAANGEMIGIVDYVPSNFKGDLHTAFLELLMIASSFRKRGIGKVVVEAIENEIRDNAQVSTILSGVQVNNPQALEFWQRNGYHIVSGPELLPDQTTVFGLRKDLVQRD